MTTAVVVGSGPNGLAGAIRLAQAGLSVTVLEAHERPGGGTRTSELTLPGLLHDDCAAFHPTGVASPFFSSLGLEEHGLRWRWPEIDLAHPLDDGRAGYATRSLAASATASLGVDAARWQRILGPMVRHFDDLVDEVFQPVTHLPRHPVTLGRFGVKALQPATWTTARFRDDPARALFSGVAAHVFGRLDTPLSGSVGLMLTATAHAVGWPVAEGGTASITRALLSVLTSLGGTVRTGVRVTSLDQVRELTGGAAPDVVLLDTAPAGVLDIVGDRLPPRVRRALARYTYGPAAFKVDLAIEGDIPWTNEACRRAGTLHLGGTAEEVAAIEAATVRGEMPERPFVLLGQQYLADPSRSSGTTHPVYAYAYVPHGYDGDATEAVLSQVERFAPGFRERVLAVAPRGPAALEAYNANYVGGDISAGANTARQVAFRPRIALSPYELGVPGVYLCSAATPPGAGVHGMGGFHAAETALARLR
ncbi:phytoene desaturase family protein [Pimelobacter simplex]|uniref:phytoene desaturase family protein n=1 Tax=Nocardioides simplex TaxID=2045 RepID=UPI00214FB7E1|nr:NAD(P)/FAD-dependent oxidoreductase [Pimelobacter simplex]UUW91998.1 NAD(P)/FAD-dependent oxidoreductase [Pimelobacter simplex]UUW95825.1 NAD(P)/FAD-dependent oxidoreductase [Pimelobacter simplex]